MRKSFFDHWNPGTITPYRLSLIWKKKFRVVICIDDYIKFSSPYTYTKKGYSVNKKAPIFRIRSGSKHDRILKDTTFKINYETWKVIEPE